MNDLPRLYKDADSRLKGHFGQVTHPTLPLQRTYCFLCGKPWGYSSTESSHHVAPQHILVTCDDCDFEMLARGAAAVPQSVLDAFGMIREPQGENLCIGTTP